MFSNPFAVQRGAICVLRPHYVGGRLTASAFQIAPRQNWREWGGAFSML